MAWIKIPENKTEMQIGGNWVKIPSGMKEVEIPDNLLGAQPATNSAPTYAPSAPDMSKAVDATPKEKTWYDKVGEFADQISPINVIKGVGKELGGMLEYSHYDGATGKELEAKKATEALARAKHAGDDRNIISQLVGDESKDQAVKERTENLLYNWAKKNNYDDVREANGKYYLQKGDNFIPVDEPGIGDSVSTYLNEMGVPMGAISVASALLPTKKLSTAQKAISTALATAGASGAGAAMDLIADKRILGDETINGDDYLKHALRGASDDALISGPLATMASPAVKEALKKGVSKASDYSIVKPIFRYVVNDNIGGAQKAMADKLGGEANVAVAQNLSKEALDEDMYKALLNDDKTYTLPNVGNEKAQKGINYVNEKILAPAQKATRDIIKGDKIKEQEMDLLLTALGNDAKGAEIIANTVANDPKSFSKIYKMSSDLNADAKNTLLNMVDKKKTADILSGYEKRTKDNFGEVINALDDAFAGKEASANLLQAKHELGTQALRLPAGYRDSTLELLGNTKGFKGLNEVRNVLSADMARLTAPDAITAGTKKTLGKMIEAVDNAIDNVAEQAFNNPALSQKAKDVLKQARSEYALFKELQNSKIYHDVMGELKSSGDITNSLLKALNAENGLDFKALTSRLSSSEQEALETNLIRGVIEKFSKDGITDFSKVSAALKDAPFESKRAVEIMSELNKKAPILNNTSALLEKLTAINPKAKELQQGIGHSVTGALKTMKRNLAIERLKSLLPVLGNDASLKNHIRNAINNAGNLKSVINNLEKIEIKDAPENSTKLLEAFKNEVKALREEAQTGEIKGDGFVVKNGGKLTFMDEAKFELSKELQGKTDLGEKISTSLAWLHSKHPEMFENKRAVKELIDYVLDEPNTIKAGKSENSVYLGKKDGTKIKDIVVNKSENKIIHANRRRMSTDEIKADGKDAHIPLHTDTMPAGATGANARSSANESIIPKQTQELDKTLENRNVKPYKNKEDALVKEGYLNPTWEPQLKTIAKEHALDEAKLKEIFLDQTINTSKGRKPNFFLDLGDIVPTYGKSKRSPEYTNNLREIDNKLQQAYEAFVKPLSASESKKIKTLYANPHIASGLLGGTANGADENGNVSPEEFAKGFVYALFGSKITAEGVKKVSPELYNKILSISKKPSEEIKNIVDNAGVDKLAKQEKRGIYNVTYNGKNAIQIKQDLDNINDAIKYERGNIGKGAKHISIRHLDDENKAGFVTKEELLNLGENVRNFIKEHKEPFVNKKNARIYEWEDDKGVRFKLVVSNKNGEGRGLPLGKSQDVSSITNDLRPATKKGLSPSGSLDDIITFYSDRNLKEPMKFENPKLKLLDAIDTSSDKVGLVKKVLLNKDISDGVKAKAVNRLTKNKISQGAKTSYTSTKNSDNN